MTKVQRLFDNRYTPSSPQRTGRGGGAVRPMIGAGVRSAPHRSRLRGIPSVALGLPILLAVAATAAAGVPSGTPTVQPWSHYDTGRVNVVFPSALPSVELFQDANASLSATLAIAGVYEIDPTASGGPEVVAGAFPFDVQQFNGTSVGAAIGTPILMSANLPIYPVGIGLFDHGAQVVPTGAPVGATTLTVTFSPTTSTATAAGVGINWSVTGWTAATGDLLAVGFDFGFGTSGKLTACEGSSLLHLAAPPCAGSGIASGSTLWGGQYTSLEGDGGSGPLAVVSWAGSIDYGTAATPVTMGAYASGGGAAELVLGSVPATGAAPARGTVAFALEAPTVVTLSTLVVGNGLVYVVSGVGVAALAAAAVVGVRRRDRRTLEEL